MSNYVPVIGLEIHAELATKSKMFCGCDNVVWKKDKDGVLREIEPNIVCCPICMGFPGTLPAINEDAIKCTIKTGLALNCKVPSFSKFDRKNYFYPDLPKGYQISQYDQPLTENGYLILSSGKKIGITRIHLEEDTGKLVHLPSASYSLVDYNRAGTPLMELVTNPDMESVEEVQEFCKKYQLILRYLEVSRADMEKGEMRCEANISVQERDKFKMENEEVKPIGKYKLNPKAEIKNLNSFRAVEDAVIYEIKRQTQELKNGGKLIQETRGWDKVAKKTFSQREKESAHDYRYFPEPDLPPLKIAKEEIRKIKNTLPEMPDARLARFIEEYNLTEKDAKILTSNKDLADFFERSASEAVEWLSTKGGHGPGCKRRTVQLTCNWVLSKLSRLLKDRNLAILDAKITAENFAEFIVAIHERKISSTGGQKLLERMLDTGKDPSVIIEEENLAQVSDESELFPVIDKVISENEKVVSDYKAGSKNAISYLIGQVMAKTKGKADPQAAAEILKKKLD